MNEKFYDCQTIFTFILDKADRMCSMGLVRDIKRIETEMPKQRQTLCFSATMTGDVQKIVEELIIEPVTISVIKSATNDHIGQDIVHSRDKTTKLRSLSTCLLLRFTATNLNRNDNAHSEVLKKAK